MLEKLTLTEVLRQGRLSEVALQGFEDSFNAPRSRMRFIYRDDSLEFLEIESRYEDEAPAVYRIYQYLLQ